MANTRSAEKKNRQRVRRQSRNITHKTAMRTAVKRVRAAIEENSRDDANAALVRAVKLIDRAATKGVIKRRTASRSVSRLTTAVNALK